jgi:hypothetical protein
MKNICMVIKSALPLFMFIGVVCIVPHTVFAEQPDLETYELKILNSIAQGGQSYESLSSTEYDSWVNGAATTQNFDEKAHSLSLLRRLQNVFTKMQSLGKDITQMLFGRLAFATPGSIITVPSITAQTGQNLHLFAKIWNTGSAPATTNFDNQFSYQFNGTSGTWIAFPTTNTYAELPPSGRAVDSANVSVPIQTGTLYIRHCLDINDVIPEVSEDNCTISTGITITSNRPVLVNPTHASVTTSSATLGATITSDGGTSITSRGTCWDLTTDPLMNCTSASGTQVSPFSHSRTGLPAGTTIYYRGYAVNASGAGYSPTASFTTNGTSYPNLVSENIVISGGSYVQGATISISAAVRNSSSVSTGGSFRDDFTYQWNGTGGTWNNFTGNTVSKAAHAAGATTVDGPISLTLGQSGTLHIQHCVDSGNIINEGANETPNCTVATALIAASSADLIPETPHLPILTVAQGAPIEMVTGAFVTGPIRNTGTATSGPHNLGGFYIDYNDDGIADYTQPIPRQTASVPPHPTNGYWMDLSWWVPLNAPPGNRYRVSYIVDVDNEVPESNEGNNFSGWSPYFTVTAAPASDLVPSIPRIKNANGMFDIISVVQGDTVTLTIDTITNTGVASAGAHNIGGFYIDYNNDGVADYTASIPRQTNTTSVGGTYTRQVFWQVPFAAPLGSNYRVSYIVDVDNEVPESNEGNNFSGWSNFLEVTGPPSVRLPSVFRDASDNVTVTYSKNFATCGHILNTSNTVLHVANLFCDPGNITKVVTAAEFNAIPGQQVKMCHGNNYSVCSPLVVVGGILAIPTGLIVDTAACGTGQINISWNSVSGATSYKLYDGATLIYTGASTGYSHTGLTANSAHSYSVKASNAGGDSASTASVGETAPNICAPAMPATPRVTVGACGTGAIDVSWAAVSGATNYNLTDNGMVTYAGAGTYFNVGGHLPASSHTYTLVAANAGGTSSPSNPVTVTAPDDCVPAIPTGLAAATAACGSGQISVSWDSVGGATAYILKDGGSTIYTGGGVAYAHTGLVADSEHDYFVAAVNNAGTSSFSGATAGTAPTTCSASNLVSENLVLTGTYKIGETITINADVLNAGTLGTGLGFNDEFTYQWDGTSGPWLTMTGGVVAQSALAASASSPDSVSFGPLVRSGTLYIQHCVDSGGGTGVVNEGSAETPNCSVSSGTIISAYASCPATTNVNCNLSLTSHGGTNGTCATGYANSCSYSCNDGTWTQVTNTCTPPSVSSFKICLQSNSSDCADAFSTLITATGTLLTVSWVANADSCTSITGPGFSVPGSAVSGSENITANSSADTTDRYQIGCQYGTGVPVQSWVDVTTLQALPELTSGRTTVRKGETITLDWDTNNGDESVCTLTGASLSGNDALLNGVGSNETGSIDITILGRTTFILTCGGLSDVKTVEIVPTSWEG